MKTQMFVTFSITLAFLGVSVKIKHVYGMWMMRLKEEEEPCVNTISIFI